MCLIDLNKLDGSPENSVFNSLITQPVTKMLVFKPPVKPGALLDRLHFLNGDKNKAGLNGMSGLFVFSENWSTQKTKCWTFLPPCGVH